MVVRCRQTWWPHVPSLPVLPVLLWRFMLRRWRERVVVELRIPAESAGLPAKSAEERGPGFDVKEGTSEVRKLE